MAWKPFSVASLMTVVFLVGLAPPPAAAVIHPYYEISYPVGSLTGCMTNLFATGHGIVWGTTVFGAGDPVLGGFIGSTGATPGIGGAITCPGGSLPLAYITVNSFTCDAASAPGSVGESTISITAVASLGPTLTFESDEGRCVRLTNPN